ncbi:hypothetical protein, partial [Flavobacterium oreochromis]|uniref:hypothetical protein n=1 Tax=Flavobacterium oreochromis TaxID=2906078 RepID=UPI001F214188
MQQGNAHKMYIWNVKKAIQRLLIFLVLWVGVIGKAQVYPVQVTPVFNTPYSSSISDYATSMDIKMRLLIHTTDL